MQRFKEFSESMDPRDFTDKPGHVVVVTKPSGHKSIKHYHPTSSGAQKYADRVNKTNRVGHKATVHKTDGRKVHESLDESKGLAAKAKKSGISVGTLRKVYNRGVAAWKTGHRPGTTPEQWGHARVNAFIVKKKKGGLNHDKDLA
jgi:hypothetical protein